MKEIVKLVGGPLDNNVAEVSIYDLRLEVMTGGGMPNCELIEEDDAVPDRQAVSRGFYARKKTGEKVMRWQGLHTTHLM